MQIVRDRFALFIFGNAQEEFRIKLAFAHLQQRRERVRHGRLLVADERRVGADRFHRNARGEQIAVRVEDVAAPRRLPEFALRVVLRQFRQFVMAEHLQIHQPAAEAGEGRADQQRQRQHPSKLHSFCHFKIGRPPVAVGSSLPTRHERRPKSLLRQRHARLPRGQLARRRSLLRRRGGRFRQPPNLRGLRRNQAEIQLAHPLIQHHRRTQIREPHPQLFVVLRNLLQMQFALANLLAQAVNLIFLPDVADRRAGNQHAQKQRA